MSTIRIIVFEKYMYFKKTWQCDVNVSRASFEQQKQHFNHKFIITIDYPLVCIWFGFVFEFTFAFVFYPVLFHFLNLLFFSIIF